MKDICIEEVDLLLDDTIQKQIDSKTKPLGALGKLEALAKQIARVQKTLTPCLNYPHLLVFAGDHGIADAGISAYPKAVTHQMVMNFLNGGAAVNVFAKQHQFNLKVVDAGVDHDFKFHPDLLNFKIRKGTRNTLLAAAMTEEELHLCFDHAHKVIETVVNNGSNIVGFGEMGIGNTASASLIMSALLKIEIENCVGRGTGLNNEQLENKIKILKEVVAAHKDLDPSDPLEVLKHYAGYEVAMMTASMLVAASKGLLILVDGFIATAAFLAAYKLNPNLLDYAIFCHVSEEKGHRMLLDYLHVEPLMDLNMRLGEGTGCAVSYPILQSAVNFFNDMASFEAAGVSNKN